MAMRVYLCACLLLALASVAVSTSATSLTASLSAAKSMADSGSSWEVYTGGLVDEVQLDVPIAAPAGRAMSVIMSAGHLTMMAPIASEGDAPKSMASTSSQTEEGEYISGMLLQSCMVEDGKGDWSVRVMCMDKAGDHGLQGCTTPEAFNFTIHILYYSESLGSLERGAGVQFLVPWGGGDALASAFLSVTTGKVKDGDSITVTASALFAPPQKLVYGTDRPLSVGVSSKESGCPVVYGGDFDNYAHTSGNTTTLAASTAELKELRELKSNTDYYVFFHGSDAAGGLYAVTVSLVPGTGSGSSGLSSGWVVTIAIFCFLLGAAVVVVAGGAFYQFVVVRRRAAYENV